MPESSIAIIGIACEYPDATTPEALWENVLARRQSFRLMPNVRLDRDSYFDPDPKALDKTYLRRAALIKNYHFDRVAFRITGESYRGADLVHWLALDVASRALADAGYPDGIGLPSNETGVLLGNSLTGEFSRASIMRLRWPYVRRTVQHRLERDGFSAERQTAFLVELEREYKQPFAAMDGDALAGGLANTIAGRISNYYNLRGGGYIVDGACSSSLLAVANACSALAAGDIEIAISGGVDLSLDPFELVGFARTGALAHDRMRIFDKNPTGFLPGEGCGMLVLRRYEDARAAGDRIYAVIRGWGLSSDGKGGLTRPSSIGQMLAIDRAYRRAGLAPQSVAYYEGHGTGTKVGDDAELTTLIRARRHAEFPAVLGSIKANIGHTKAASGAASLIKTVMALHRQVIPPTTACVQAHDLLKRNQNRLRVSDQGELWPRQRELRAAVSSMGFGGINAHLVLDGMREKPRTTLSTKEIQQLATPQEKELFAFSANDAQGLSHKLQQLAPQVRNLSFAELTDLAAHLAGQAVTGSWRAAILAGSPEQLADALEALAQALAQGEQERYDQRAGLFFAQTRKQPRIGYLFSGQGAPVRLTAGPLGRRYPNIGQKYAAEFPAGSEEKPQHENNQPAVTLASLVGWHLLQHFGIEAEHALGHSLGELSALQWAGALKETDLLATIAYRAHTMHHHSAPGGGMTAIAAEPEKLQPLLEDHPVVIACYNGPQKTVIAGPLLELEIVEVAARQAGYSATRLPVTHAFHSDMLSEAAPLFRKHLEGLELRPLTRTVFSTVSGTRLTTESKLVDLLSDQFTEPVRFQQALAEAEADTDLWIEVGPGRILTNLASELSDTPAVATDMCNQMTGLLATLAAAYVTGVQVHLSALYEDRFVRPYDPEAVPEYLVNPCEQRLQSGPEPEPEEAHETTQPAMDQTQNDALGLVKQLVAQRTELPEAQLDAQWRLLDDLHMNSISVAELVAEASRCLAKSPPRAPTELANASLAELAERLEAAANLGEGASQGTVPEGVSTWIRCFKDHWQAQPLTAHQETRSGTPHYFGPQNEPLQEKLALALGRVVCVLLPSSAEITAHHYLLEAAKTILREPQKMPFVLLQQEHLAASFARTLSAELPNLDVLVLTAPFDDQLPARVAAEKKTGYQEVSYDREGIRRVPILRESPLIERGQQPLGSEDVCLVSGGGKGIGAECALALYQEAGTRFILLGRSDPSQDTELAGNLNRFRQAGMTFHYVRADVSDAQAVSSGLDQARAALGEVTAILHSAGLNQPKQLAALEDRDFEAMFAPKLAGMENLLAVTDPGRLKLIVVFGSIIARIGLEGEAHYALANERLDRALHRFAAEHPSCRCLNLAWSVWSGVGMGERLGTLESLIQSGITPITLDRGLALFCRVLADPNQQGTLVVSGRFGQPNSVDLGKSELPFLRFLEQVRLFYPGIELITDNLVSVETDPYLADHIYEGKHILPAVMGIEAMSSAAMALLGREVPPNQMSQLTLERPVIVPRDKPLTLRIAVEKQGPDTVEAVIRSEETGYHVNHFKARFHFDAVVVEGDLTSLREARALPPLILKPNDLYGPVFFHGGRFQRVAGYRRLGAYNCIAELAAPSKKPWYGRFLPAALVTGDPGRRDAVLHAIQACIPHKSVLPLTIGQWISFQQEQGQQFLHARELAQHGDCYHYDVDVIAADGSIVEVWRDLVFKEIHPIKPQHDWHIQLFIPYVQRLLAKRAKHHRLGLDLEIHPEWDRDQRTQIQRRRLKTELGSISYRPDGKPESPRAEVSFSHLQDMSLVAWSSGALACDLENVTHRDPWKWQAMLGEAFAAVAQFLVQDHRELADLAATRLWCTRECMRKAGLSSETAPFLLPNQEDELVFFSIDGHEIATLALDRGKRMLALLYQTVQTGPVPIHVPEGSE